MGDHRHGWANGATTAERVHARAIELHLRRIHSCIQFGDSMVLMPPDSSWVTGVNQGWHWLRTTRWEDWGQP